MKQISIAVLIFVAFAVGPAQRQGDAQELVAPTVRWDNPKVRDNAAFRELKRRVLSGEASEQQRQYFGWLEPRIYPFEAIPEGAYESARWQQKIFLKRAAEVSSPASSTSWTFLGPRNIEGRVTAIALHPTDSGVIYAAGESGGIFKTTDGGHTWTTSSDELPDLRVFDVQFLPSNPQTLFAGAGTGHFYISTDAGSTWSTRAVLPDAQGVDRIRIDPQNPSRMYVVQQDFWGGLGVYRSSDGGFSWSKSLSTSIVCPPTCPWPPAAGFNDLAMDSSVPRTLYAVLNQDGIYRTLDGGDTWTRLNTPTSGLPTTVQDGAVGTAPSATGTVYATLRDPADAKGLYVSLNYGETWHRQSSPSQCCFGDIVVDPTDANLLYFSNFGSLYKSRNGGITLTTIPQTHVDQQSFAIQPGNSQLLWAGNDGGLDKSTDQGATWSGIGKLPVTQYYGLAVMPNNPQLILGVTQDNWINRYHGTLNWDQLFNNCGYGDLSAAVFDPRTSSIAYAQSVQTYVNKTVNGGTSWFCDTTGLDNTGSVWKAPLAMFSQDPNILYAGGNRVHMTRDGATWNPISPVLTASGGLSAIRASASNSGRIYAGFSDAQLFRTDTGGVSWTEISGAWSGRYITALAVDPSDDAVVYLTLGGFGISHVWRTTDAGSSWKDIGASLPDAPYNDVAMDAGTGRVVVVNDIGGVFETRNFGLEWTPAGDLSTLPNTFVSGVALESGVDLTVSTYGRSMWRLHGNGATTTTSLVSSMNPSVQGKPVTFTAVVSSPTGTPTGKVEFLNGSTVLATPTITSGSAQYTTSKLQPGANSITAIYLGDSSHDSSTSPPVNQFVLAATTTTLTSSPNPSAYGQAVVFTAKVNSSIGAPPNGETVTFKKGTTVLGTGTLSGGSATFMTSALKVGTAAVAAVYGGDSKFATSTSKTLKQVVSKATTMTTLASSLNPSNVGQAVTFTARVVPQFSGTVTGTVTFYDGATVLKTGSLSGGKATLTTSKLTSGTHTITATYNGSTSFFGSSASLTQTVN
jgi:photosystem II stability/assembly factor-like uncharacterized protein